MERQIVRRRQRKRIWVQRQEGSPWRSGSTYLVSLPPDGRVFLHAKDMSLSGGLLKRVIYEAILEASGTSLADVTNPATAQSALNNAIAGDGGRFDVPGIPGASGYATAFRYDQFGTPRILLAGFDLDRSHLVDEDIVHPQPTVAAEKVVDRASLKAFVTEAGNYFIRVRESGDLAAGAKARIAFRDPNGPWRHGPVYLALMDPESRTIWFHGAFPDRFEFRRGGISRDAVTGELIVDQLVAAANSGPEGGFWLYHFDNPTDDTDSADIPKVGYARIITANIPLPDGSTRPTSFIMNSGFYLTSDSVFVQRILGALDEGETSIMFGMTTPEDGDVVAGDAVAVSVTGIPRHGPLRLPPGRLLRSVHLSRRRSQPRRRRLVCLGHPGPAG